MRRLVVVMMIILVFTACTKAPVKVGLIGDLSSKNAQLAIDGRNGAELAIEEINEAGGIKGRPIELVVKDDAADVGVAQSQHKAFKEEGVAFIIGHLNSSMVDAVNQSQGEDMLFMSPSMSTDRLNDLDDYVLRTSPTNRQQAVLFYEYCLKKDIKDLVVVYDKTNAEYTENLYKAFKGYYEEAGYSIKGTIAYDAREDALKDVVASLKSLETENLFIIAQATDTAYIMQSLQKDNQKVQGYSVSWSMTGDLVENGGAAVDGMVFIGTYVPEEKSAAQKAFEGHFRERYSYDATFISILAYDATKLLAQGLEAADNLTPEAVKEAIISIGAVEGLVEDFDINPYGDSNRQYMLYQLVEGEFKPLRHWR